MEEFQKKIDGLEILLKRQNILNKEILTLEEAAQYLVLSKSCIYKMTSNKEIPHYIPRGKKIYFRRIELDRWILESRVTPVNEIGMEIKSYLCGTSKSLEL
jgi:excisionase family DNA binding protein